jgi:hypothetical protein
MQEAPAASVMGGLAAARTEVECCGGSTHFGKR